LESVGVAAVGKRVGTRRAGPGKRSGKRSEAQASVRASGPARRRPVGPGTPTRTAPAVARARAAAATAAVGPAAVRGGSARRPTLDGRGSLHAPHDARRCCPNSCPRVRPLRSRPGRTAAVQRPAVRPGAAPVRRPAGNTAGNFDRTSSSSRPRRAARRDSCGRPRLPGRSPVDDRNGRCDASPITGPGRTLTASRLGADPDVGAVACSPAAPDELLSPVRAHRRAIRGPPSRRSPRCYVSAAIGLHRQRPRPHRLLPSPMPTPHQAPSSPPMNSPAGQPSPHPLPDPQPRPCDSPPDRQPRPAAPTVVSRGYVVVPPPGGGPPARESLPLLLPRLTEYSRPGSRPHPCCRACRLWLSDDCAPGSGGPGKVAS